jgi:NFACT protein RNA binding domain
MVLFFTSTGLSLPLQSLVHFINSSQAHDPPVTIYMGRDKVESAYSFSPCAIISGFIGHSLDEELIKYAWPQDVWFHVDKLSSAHVYLRLCESIPSWDAIPEPLLVDCAQLVKANSIDGTSPVILLLSQLPNLTLMMQATRRVTLPSFIRPQTTSRYASSVPYVSSPALLRPHIKKTGDMAVGQVSFHDDKRVRLLACAE